ncbi:MAG: 4-hydroxy-3-methylbut-2-enyl diphosphate reductase [Firmicutes bacterium]|nr:4-hydroxy-3-methylbut-2-enyl diphosphate reductase [Bacillota bacterium]
MRVIILTIKESGFCHGVQTAVNRADGKYRHIQNGQKVYLYGDLVNNSHVMSKYIEKGFLVTDNINDIEPGATVIIRAHGVPRAVYESLQTKDAIIEDCTCVKIKKTHKIVETTDKNVIIIGQKSHPEVVGIRGWCDNAVILETEADLQNINCGLPVCVVGQTTCKRDWWNKAVELVLKICPSAEIHDTLCSATKVKCEKSAELAACVDIMIIVGDKKSANSIELYNTCRKVCDNTIFVSCLGELLAMEVKNLHTAYVGLVGSASAPAEIVDEIHEYLNFAAFLAESKQEIDRYTNNEMENVIKACADKPFVYEAVRELHEQNRDGKRIRGAMIRLGEKAASDESVNFLPAAMAYELFQTAILIHDDVIDRSEARRGRKTIHAKSRDAQLAGGSDKESAKHFGISQALCVGDYGLFLANNLLANANNIDNTAKIRIFRQFSEIQLITLEGEIMDVTLPVEQISLEDNYDGYMAAVYEIYRSKTAWYTIAGPLMIGAICGGADECLINELRDIALPIGIAFQIKDDLLGMYASDEALGKPAISDMVEKKQTLVYGYAYKHASLQQRSILNLLYGKQDAAQSDLETVREIFTVTGAKKFAEDEIARLSGNSLDLINGSQVNDECKALLRGLVSYLTTREY